MMNQYTRCGDLTVEKSKMHDFFVLNPDEQSDNDTNNNDTGNNEPVLTKQ